MTVSIERRRGAILAALAVMLTTVLLVAAPRAGAAATSASTSGSTATINFDGADDTVSVTVEGGLVRHGVTGGGFTSVFDWDTAAAGEQAVPANGAFTVVLNGGDGADNLTVTATVAEIAKAVVNGDAGNDLLTGARTADDLRGGAGNDRLAGFVGNDDMEGGDGNDTLVWNNGDNNDVMDGDAGNDGVEVNGAPTLGDTFTIQPAGGRIRFDRTNLVPFSLDILTERLEVNGLGGNDTATASGSLAALTLLSLNGGAGVDALTGADGPDLIQGGEENDSLAGGGGDDRILGDRGNDAMNGGAGDDTLVWNNGDNNDAMEGETGRDAIEVNGSPGAGDVFTVVPAGGRIDFDRTNLVAFSLDIGTSEAMSLNGLGGNDNVTVGEVAAFLVAVAGGAGNDTLTGAGAAETLLGGSGDDIITPGGGGDVAAGDEGNDTIAVRDGVADFVRCGDGADQVTADAAALDVGMEGCEVVSRPPLVTPPVQSPPVVTPPVQSPPVAIDTVTLPVAIGGGTVRARGGVATIRLSCPAASPVNCQGTLGLLTARRVRLGGVMAVLEVGRTGYDLAPGGSATRRVRLGRGVRRLANRRGKLAVRAIASTGTSGRLASSSQRITLDFGRRSG